MAEKVKLTDFPSFKENPFLPETMEVVKENTVKKRKYFSSQKVLLDVVNTQTGETEGYQAFTKFVKVDKEQFTKIYPARIKALFDLGNAALRVFCYIQTKVQQDRDTFIFDIESCEEFTKQSRPTIYRGLAELVKNEIIARGKYDFLYYINPLIFFNGDRIVFIEAMEKIDENSKEDNNQLSLEFPKANQIKQNSNFDTL